MTITLRKLAASAAICLGFASTFASLEAQELTAESVKPADSTAKVAGGDEGIESRRAQAVLELETLRKRVAKLEQITGNPNDPAVVRAKRRVWESEKALIDLAHGAGATDPPPLSGEARILKKLGMSDSPRLLNQSLGEALQYLEKRADLKITTDPKALEEAGITTATIVNLRAKDIKIEDALRLILEPLGLTYRIEGDGLVVTGQNTSPPVAKPRDMGKGDLEKLRDLAARKLQALEKRDNESNQGKHYSTLMTEQWLEKIQAALEQPDNGQRPEAVELLLDMYMGGDFTEKTLEEALEIVHEDSGLEIVVDWDGLKGSGVTTKTSIHGFAGTLSLGNVLDAILRPKGLAAQVDGNRLIVKLTPISKVAETMVELGSELAGWREKLLEAIKIEKDPDNPNVTLLAEQRIQQLEAIEVAARKIDQIIYTLNYSKEEKKAVAEPKPETSLMESPKVDPGVVVTAITNNKKYSVQGEVLNPGDQWGPDDDTVVDAIKQAGGLMTTDLRVKVVVLRPAASGSLLVQTLSVDLSAIIEKGDKTTNHRLQDGDRVIVSPRPTPSATDYDTRLKELERKLESILRSREEGSKK